jgi:zinc transporter
MHSPLSPAIGLLWGFAFREGRATRVIDETAPAVFAEPHDWAWMHFTLSDHRARRFIETFTEAPPEARTLLLGNETRLQLKLGPDSAWGILPDIERDFEGAGVDAGRLAFFLDGRHLITVRHRPLCAIDAVREEAASGIRFATPTDALVRIVESFVETAEDRLAVLTHDIDRIEDRVLADRDDFDTARLGPARRELSRHHREFLALRGALARAQNVRGNHAGCPLTPHLPGLTQAAEDFDRDAGALADRARLLYEEIDTRIAATTNRSLRTLTILSTLLLPPTFIAGAFGMNLIDIPWGQSPGGFWWAMALCAAVVAACYVFLKRFRIL